LFLDFQGDTYTYEQVEREVNRLARGLQALGLKPGDVLAVMMDNSFDAVCCWFAANRVGAIYAAINTALKGEFLRHVLTDTGARVLIVEKEFLERLSRFGVPSPDIEIIITRGGLGSGDDLEPSTNGVDTRSLDELREDGPGTVITATSPGDASCLVYTGGTTGPSKGCVISHGYICHRAQAVLTAQGRGSDEIIWNPLPIYHMNLTAAAILPSMLIGGTASIGSRFSLSGFWPEIERSGARIACILGSMISLIARAPDTPSSLRCRGQLRVVYGAPISADMQAILRERFQIEMAGTNSYGLTEATPIVSLPLAAHAAPGSSGRRNEDFEVLVVDDNDNALGPNEVGEVLCRPRRPNIMFSGYWRRPEATLATMRDLWFHTGDLGKFDEDGYFYFCDRKKDYLRRRGENISSYEMEQVYLQHPAIKHVAVHAVASDLTEDDVKVTAVLNEDVRVTPAELFEWSIERVPYFALPRYIEFRADLPISEFGRLRKYQLREEGCTPGTWDRETAGAKWERR
jgi:crotonobetaine/carnitine-CoA ligase